MANKPDLSQSDSSDRGRQFLQAVLSEEEASEVAPTQAVTEARFADSLYRAESSRDAIRLLFISRDDSLLNQATQSLDGFLNMSDVFDEVHIVILRPGIRARNPVLRVADNVWLYIATAKHWWRTPQAALDLVDKELQFADGFRPDLIVARDPYESAYAANLIGKRFERPVQVHVLEDFTSKKFLSAEKSNRWRKLLTKYTVPKVGSVRTSSQQLQMLVEQRFPSLKDVEVLPRFNNYRALAEAQVVVNIKEKYRQFVFIILFIGELNHESTLHRALDGTRFVLRNPRVGMVVVGDGPARSEFIKRAEILGISKQVVFEKRVEDLTSYMKTADVLLVTDQTAASDELVLRGAATGVPLLVTATTLRTDLFTDMQSALIIPTLDTVQISEKLSIFLNDLLVRKVVKEGAARIVEEKLYEDPATYRDSYRSSIERGLLVDGE